MLHKLVICIRRRLLAALALLCMAQPIAAQLGVGASSMYIATGTDFVTDRLVLIPSTPLTLTATTVVQTSTPYSASNSPITSIARVYPITPPITFSGIVGIQYFDGELGANTENLLQIAYRAADGGWVTTTGSTVNTVTNYVYIPVTNVSMGVVTATTIGVALPVTYSSFSAYLNDRNVQVKWEARANGPLAGFNIELSPDGRTWKKTAYVPAVEGQSAYTYQDEDLDFAIRYYRVAIVEASGQTSYTKLVTIRKPAADFKVYVQSGGNNRIIHFMNATPDGVQVFDINSRLLKKINQSKAAYAVGNIPTGTYILRFTIGSEHFTKQVVFP